MSLMSVDNFKARLAALNTVEEVAAFVKSFSVAAPDTHASSASVFYTRNFNPESKINC